MHTFIAESQRTVRIFATAASGSISIFVIWRWTFEPGIVEVEWEFQRGGYSHAKADGGGEDKEELHLCCKSCVKIFAFFSCCYSLFLLIERL